MSGLLHDQVVGIAKSSSTQANAPAGNRSRICFRFLFRAWGQITHVYFSRPSVSAEGSTQRGRAKVECGHGCSRRPASVRHVDDVWRMTERNARAVIVVIDVAQVMKGINRPRSPEEQPPCRRVLMPTFKVLHDAHRIGRPGEWRHAGILQAASRPPPSGPGRDQAKGCSKSLLQRHHDCYSLSPTAPGLASPRPPRPTPLTFLQYARGNRGWPRCQSW